MAGEWRERNLGELTENFDGMRVPVKEADRRSGPYPYYGTSGIVDYVDGFLFDGENLRTRNTPVAFLARGKFWVNNHAHLVRGNHEADTRFLMYSLAAADISGYLTGSTMFREFAIQSMTGTSGRQRVPAESLAHFKVAVPPRPIAEAFGRAVKPRFARASAAVRESRTLAALRDTLLPKLISGELRTCVAEKHLEALP
jgi:restriction endonuclease S subunit